MRIACLSWESLHSIRVGGLAPIATGFAEELAKRGHDVHMFTRAGENQSDYGYISGVHYHRCKFDPGQNILQFAYNMSKAMVADLHEVEEDLDRFDLVHGHDWLVVDALHDLKNEGHPVVLTYHSTQYGRNGDAFSDSWEFKEISGKEWYGGYIANRVTTVSNYMKNELYWLYKIPIDKIDVIPNAIDPRKRQVRVDPWRVKRKYGIHPLATTILFAGRLEHQKGPDLLIEAIPGILKNRWDVEFIISGDGSMRTFLERRVNELRVGNVTKFLGMLSYWDYLELLSSCDMVCIPSRNEPFGIALLEAWATGRPVVVSDVGGMGENIENFVDGIKVNPTAKSIGWGINYLLNNPEVMKQIASAGVEKVKLFTWDISLQRLLGTFNKVMEK